MFEVCLNDIRGHRYVVAEFSSADSDGRELYSIEINIEINKYDILTLYHLYGLMRMRFKTVPMVHFDFDGRKIVISADMVYQDEASQLRAKINAVVNTDEPENPINLCINESDIIIQSGGGAVVISMNGCSIER